MHNLTLMQNIQPHFIHIINRICTPSWKIPISTIKTHNLMLLYEGKGIFSANGQRFEAFRGDLIYYRPGNLRSAHTSPENLVKAFAVDFLYTCPILKDGCWKFYTPNLPLDTIQRIDEKYVLEKLISLFDRLASTWVGRKRDKIAICRTTFIEIITLLLDWKSGYSFDSSKLQRVDRAIQFMSENYRSKLTLKMLADEAGVSTSYFSSIFREVTGTSPIDYLIDIRMSRSKVLLLEGVSVSETAKLVGFDNVYYFSRYFKKYEGISPSQYCNKNLISDRS